MGENPRKVVPTPTPRTSYLSTWVKGENSNAADGENEHAKSVSDATNDVKSVLSATIDAFNGVEEGVQTYLRSFPAGMFEPENNDGEREWYFFTPRDRKYRNGTRPNRAAGNGYWKATGADKKIIHKKTDVKIGCRKALVFYVGKAPKGTKTNWIMHEYRIEDTVPRARLNMHDMRLDNWVLCRIYEKTDKGTKENGKAAAAGEEDAELSDDDNLENDYDGDGGAEADADAILSEDAAIANGQNQFHANPSEIENALQDPLPNWNTMWPTDSKQALALEVQNCNQTGQLNQPNAEINHNCKSEAVNDIKDDYIELKDEDLFMNIDDIMSLDFPPLPPS
ncbi:hypothetical protein IFM89_024444 [Coptis chinensis]|uniref:NAC domain-containing protein n=1 Tax=Coptis chinensis TaxID=261450 RepID=A0A835HGR1_9MAGN|nr:hypothetical protein IFM89_024444 [Coptis chinensis]